MQSDLADMYTLAMVQARRGEPLKAVLTQAFGKFPVAFKGIARAFGLMEFKEGNTKSGALSPQLSCVSVCFILLHINLS